MYPPRRGYATKCINIAVRKDEYRIRDSSVYNG